MHVAVLEVRSLRILADVKAEFSPGLNLIVGPNGSGKSSLLEAVHILGSGRSFRSHRLRDVIAHGESSLRVVGRVAGKDGATVTIGVEHTPTGSRLRRNGADVRVTSELAASLPSVVVTPESYRLITDGADLRRRIIDRLLFHVEPGYLEHYQRYRRALRQRNAAIRDDIPEEEFGGWDTELATAGEQLTDLRMRYLERALPGMEDTVAKLVGMPISIRFHRGWDSTVSLEQVYARSLPSDRLRGYTQAGPHRADLRFAVGGHPAQHTLSRGETKLFVTAVSVAQVRDLAMTLGYPPVVLVDDLSSELDADGAGRCLTELKATGAQLFLTAIPGHEPADGVVEGARTFHVERGCLAEVV